VNAFDRQKLWNIIYKRGIPHHLIAVIKNMYKGRKTSLYTNSRKVQKQSQELRQGYTMSPIWFNLYLDNAVRHWQSHLKFLNTSENLRKIYKTSVCLRKKTIISDNKKTLQTALHELKK
jgi:hypothetical protein